MANEEKIVKLYSNNSKKARIRRRKNKFQRIWDAEKQEYVKVRKPKFAVYTKPEKKEKTVDAQMEAIKRRNKRKKAPKKSVPVKATKAAKKPEKPATKMQVSVHNPVTRIHGINYTWDSSILRYKKAA